MKPQVSVSTTSWYCWARQLPPPSLVLLVEKPSKVSVLTLSPERWLYCLVNEEGDEEREVGRKVIRGRCLTPALSFPRENGFLCLEKFFSEWQISYEAWVDSGRWGNSGARSLCQARDSQSSGKSIKEKDPKDLQVGFKCAEINHM